MQLEDLFNRRTIVDLSFFNFRNAITAAYFADQELKVLRVNDNFKTFFPMLGSVSNAWFPDVLVQLGVEPDIVQSFQETLAADGQVLIPRIDINMDGMQKTFSLLSAYTQDDNFSYLNGVQGQFIDRTEEFRLRREREELLEEKIRDREIIEEKTRELERLANRLAKYLAPQIYQSIFDSKTDDTASFKRRNLTVFFSDIVGFTDISDAVEPERLAYIINTYLGEMSQIALQYGGTLDKFIGDAVLIFFGDPDTEGEAQDALRCVHMALAMQQRTSELQSLWQSHGISQPLRVRIGINTGYCTVGNFGSEQRLEYTALGGPVNLAARLQTRAEPDSIVMSESTWLLVRNHVECTEVESFTPKGFTRPVRTFRLDAITDDESAVLERPFKHVGEHVEVSIPDPNRVREAIEELRRISEEFEKQFNN